MNTYPEYYFSSDIKELLEEEPTLPKPPKEPEKPTILPNPGKDDSFEKKVCGIVFFLFWVVLLFVGLSSDKTIGEKLFIIPIFLFGIVCFFSVS